MNNPSICIITNNKKEFLPLLLLSDELESDIVKYLVGGYEMQLSERSTAGYKSNLLYLLLSRQYMLSLLFSGYSYSKHCRIQTYSCGFSRAIP